MKRSEMVQLIWNFVQSVESDYDFYMDKTDCDNLLKTIEQSGMLPPTIRYDSVNEYVNIKDTDILRDNDVSFAWEEE